MSYIALPNSFITVDGQRIAYRELGAEHAGPPLVMLTHLAATLDQWDPKLMDLLAATHHVIVIDLPGVGASEGSVGATIPLMARQAITIIRELGHTKINLLGLSMGGMVAQEIVRADPTLVHRLILAGTGPRGGHGLDQVTRKTFTFMAKAALHRVDPKRFIFYNHDPAGGRAAKAVLDRMAQRDPAHADRPMRVSQFITQLRAIKRWSQQPQDNLSHISHPTLIVNGDNDLQVPTENSHRMHELIPGSILVIYPDSGHGSIFQNAEQFAAEAHKFLAS
ncbi:alpha/beta fold hydrolase [Corynebacterium lizhenjunii]|uniref:alpha/beta fold hydrolase n=1 Tax=Corynebacterium lizhenjunii TaxID=2709394 RepID=UPI0013EBF4AF|nr:alpha/beta hydrolase [Corynebacterium lizhenjunii]